MLFSAGLFLGHPAHGYGTPFTPRPTPVTKKSFLSLNRGRACPKSLPVSNPKNYLPGDSFPGLCPVSESRHPDPAGEHLLTLPASPVRILDQLLKGRIKLYRLTVPEGLSMEETASAVAKTGMCGADRFLTLCRDPDFIEELAVPSHTLEGFLFPDTYFSRNRHLPPDNRENGGHVFFGIYAPVARTGR